MKKENFYLLIRCERCKEVYIDDCIDCIKKQKDMGVKVRFNDDDDTVSILYICKLNHRNKTEEVGE